MTFASRHPAFPPAAALAEGAATVPVPAGHAPPAVTECTRLAHVSSAGESSGPASTPCSVPRQASPARTSATLRSSPPIVTLRDEPSIAIHVTNVDVNGLPERQAAGELPRAVAEGLSPLGEIDALEPHP
jgi:hypothetical protein